MSLLQIKTTILGSSVTPYSLEFDTPIRTASGEYRHRCGATVELTDSDGFTGSGDAAPWVLTGSGLEASLRSAAVKLEGESVGLDTIEATVSSLKVSPAIQYALELALLDIISQRRSQPLWALLSGSNATNCAPIGINAVATDVADATAFCADGFTGLKLKVGATDIASDIARVRRVRDAVGPEITLRIDANGAYDFDSAREMAVAMADLDISLFEQPVSTTDQLIELKRQTSLPIGADEVVSKDPSFSQKMGACADFVVIKPMALGGLLPSLRMAMAADELNLGVVITSSWESIIGRTGALHLAAAVAATAKNQPAKTHSGLAHPFQKDLAPLWPIVKGAAALPLKAGLGVRAKYKGGGL